MLDPAGIAGRLTYHPPSTRLRMQLCDDAAGRVAELTQARALIGPDVSAGELAEWTAPVKRPLAVVNCASASAPFIQALSEVYKRQPTERLRGSVEDLLDVEAVLRACRADHRGAGRLVGPGDFL